LTPRQTGRLIVGRNITLILTIIYLKNFAGNKQKSYKIMRMNMFAAQDKAKPDMENIKGLNLAAVKLTIVQVTKLPL
jgi:hypothetical protein